MKTRIIGGAIAALGLAAAGLVIASQYEYESEDHEGHERFGISREDVAPARDPLYLEECGGCHFAYPPGLLPANSWNAVMDGLADHFGENAELDADTQARLRRYLDDNAADRVRTGRSPGIANAVRGETPLRITETAWFRRQHEEIPPRAVAGNPDVGSLSQCDACHTGAADGSFDEHRVRIPGWGRWDD